METFKKIVELIPKINHWFTNVENKAILFIKKYKLGWIFLALFLINFMLL